MKQMDTLIGGGRYDGLAEILTNGKESIKAVGYNDIFNLGLQGELKEYAIY